MRVQARPEFRLGAAGLDRVMLAHGLQIAHLVFGFCELGVFRNVWYANRHDDVFFRTGFFRNGY